jgi:diguanylate cyclase (GGDEF)-like protein/PAS domain S-box-containing protein
MAVDLAVIRRRKGPDMSLRGPGSPSSRPTPETGAAVSDSQGRPTRSTGVPNLALVSYLVLSAVLTIAYFALPGQHMLLWGALGITSAVAIIIGVRRNRPQRPLAWYLLAAALTSFAAGDFTYNLLTLVLHQDNPFPSLADVFYLTMVALAATTLGLFIRARTPSANSSGLIDALIISVGMGLLSWTYLIEPFVHSNDLTWQQKVLSAAYPLCDVMLLALLARLLADGGFRSRSLQMLSLGALGLLTADVFYGLIQLNGTWAVGGPVDGGWVLYYVLLGGAALHPSMGQMTTALPPRSVDIGRARLLLIAAASMVAPVDAIIQVKLGNTQSGVVHAGFSAVLFGLVMTRMWGVVRAHQQGIARERTLRTAGAALVGANDESQVVEAVRTALSGLDFGQSEIAVGLALFDGSGFRSIENGLHATFAALDSEAVRAFGGFDPALVEASTVEMLLPGPVPTGASALVMPLRSAHSLTGALLVSGDARGLILMQDAIQALGFNAALALQRMALAHEIHQRASETHFRALIQNASDVILVVGADDQITYQTPSVTRVLGYEISELAGAPIRQLLHDDDIVPSLSTLNRMRQPGVHRVTQVDWRLLRADGRSIDAEVVCSNLLDDPDVKGLVLTIRDVTERRELERELKHRAFHDGLTSLANRGLFADRLEHALRRGARLNTLVVVLFIDLDEFKVINDTCGHAVGDEVLKRVATVLAGSIRSGDTAARLGGDEFALLVEEATSIAEVEALAGRVLKALAEPLELDGQNLSARASIGIATNEHTGDAGEILQLADLALHEAKAAHKGSYRFFRDELRTDLVNRIERQDLLQRALDNGDFRLDYQPIVHMESAQIVGMEALVRWHDPVRGVIPPGAFISDAEESGLIVPLGEWVLRQAAEQAHQWQQTYPMLPPLRMSVNVSARQFREPGFAAMVADVLAQSPLLPHTLVLELTESLLIEDDGVAEVAEVLNQISALGVLFALDDFGTGYSALGYLRRFPINILKLDKSFVDDLLTSTDRGALVEAIIHLAQTLQLDLVVEGIELPAQNQRLRAMGCQLAQGFLYSRPIAPADIELLLHDQVRFEDVVTPIRAALGPAHPRGGKSAPAPRFWKDRLGGEK